MRELRIVVAGSRGFTDYDVLSEIMDRVLIKSMRDHVVFISGTAQGADRLGERYARDNDYECERYPADWDRYGRSAGYKRNQKMAKVATHLVAFWDEQSRGTRHMISIAIEAGLTVRVFNQEGIYLGDENDFPY